MVQHAVPGARAGGKGAALQLGSELPITHLFALANYETEYLHSYITIHNCSAYTYIRVPIGSDLVCSK